MAFLQGFLVAVLYCYANKEVCFILYSYIIFTDLPFVPVTVSERQHTCVSMGVKLENLA